MNIDFAGVSGFFDDAWTAGGWAAAGFFVWWLMFLAPLGRRRFKHTIDVAATPQRVWNVSFVEPPPPGGWTGAFEIERTTLVHGAPPRLRSVLRRLGSDGPFAVHVERLPQLEEPRLHVAEEESVDGVPVPPLRARLTTTRIAATKDGARVTREIEQPVTGLHSYVTLRRDRARRMKRLRAACEGRPLPAAKQGVGLGYGLLFGALAIVASMLVFYKQFGGAYAPMLAFALLLQAVLLVHEFGHWLAMRWFGHEDATITFLPFFGGAAIGAKPSASRFEKAGIALMGPGFSALVLIALAPVLGWGLELGRAFATQQGIPEDLSTLLRGLAGILALGYAAFATLINLLNLAPFARMDGAQTLDALASSHGERRLYGALLFAALAVAIYGVLGFEHVGGDIGFFALAWVFGAYFDRPPASAPQPPMTRRESLTIVCGLVATISVYALSMRLAVHGVLNLVPPGT